MTKTNIIEFATMTKKSRKRTKAQAPTDPAEAARIASERRRDPARWGTNDEALKLASNADVDQEAETRTRTRRVFRYDCFATLKLDAGQLAAVRRLQDEIAVRYRVDGAAEKLPNVSGGGSAELVTQRSLDAAERIEAVLLLTDPWHGALLAALSIPTVTEGSPVNWHAAVRRILGLIDRDAQARAVKYAAEGLRRAWVEYDADPEAALASVRGRRIAA